MITFVKGNQLVGDVEFVLCPYCDDYIDANMQILFSEHLIKHNKKITDVRTEFPNHITITLNEFNKRDEEFQKNYGPLQKLYALTQLEIKNVLKGR